MVKLKSVSKRKETVDPALQEQIKQLQDDVKTLVYNLRDTYFTQEPKQRLSDLRQVAPCLCFARLGARDLTRVISRRNNAAGW